MIMFLGMYSKAPNLDIGDKELGDLALTFSTKIPGKAFTPAQVQGNLLRFQKSPVTTVTNVAA